MACKTKTYCSDCSISYKCTIKNRNINGCCKIPFVCSQNFESECQTRNPDEILSGYMSKVFQQISDFKSVMINGNNINCSIEINNGKVNISEISQKDIQKLITEMPKKL